MCCNNCCGRGFFGIGIGQPPRFVENRCGGVDVVFEDVGCCNCHRRCCHKDCDHDDHDRRRRDRDRDRDRDDNCGCDR